MPASPITPLERRASAHAEADQREHNRVLEAALGRVRLSFHGFSTNGSLNAGRLKIPTIGFGPGDPGRAHQADEFIDIDDLEEGRRGFAALAAMALEDR